MTTRAALSPADIAYRLIARAVAHGEAAPSNAEIARACGYISRGAASTLVSHLEAEGRITVQRSRRERVITLPNGRSTAGRIKAPVAATKPEPAAAPVRPVVLRPPPPINPATRAIEQLPADGCRYPLGDVRDPRFHFCGQRALQGSSYCGHHHQRCHLGQRPAEARKDAA